MTSHTVEILYLDGCPHMRAAVDVVRAVLAETGALASVREVCVPSEADALRLRFLGSPTVRVDGRDVEPEAEGRDAYGVQCRVYTIDGKLAGLPAAGWIRDALRKP